MAAVMAGDLTAGRAEIADLEAVRAAWVTGSCKAADVGGWAWRLQGSGLVGGASPKWGRDRRLHSTGTET